MNELPMKYIFRLLLGLALCLVWQVDNFAQVFPGDADNNGRVENFDVLYTGFAYGEIGPARLGDVSQDSESFISVLWEAMFPTGQNFVFADANGNGAVDFADLLTISSNYGEEHSTVTTTIFQEGMPGLDPSISFDRTAVPSIITENSTLEIPLILGSLEQPITDINGIAFSITYDDELIADLQLTIDPLWLGGDGQVFLLQSHLENNTASERQLDMAMTRLGNTPVTSFGRIGTLSIIIEDDLIELLPDNIDRLPVAISVVGVGIIDGNFNQIPVVRDSLHLNVMHPAAISDIIDKERDIVIKVFPNPASEVLEISSSTSLEGISIHSLSGQTLFSLPLNHTKKLKLPIDFLPTGPVLLKLLTPYGPRFRKLIVAE